MPATVGYPAESITASHMEDAEDLWEDVTIGREFRKGRERIWKQSERQYQGKMTTRPNDATSDLINVNMSFSTANTILPHITGSEPEFIVAPFSADATPKNARIQEAFLNRKWRHKPVGAQKGLKASGQDYILYGDGYLKTTYQIVQRALGPDESATICEEFIDRLSPWDVWIDPNSTGIHDARWVAVRVWMTEDEARQDESLNIPSIHQFTSIDPSKSQDDTGTQQHSITSSDRRKWVVLFELYDITNQMLYVVPEEGSKQPWKVVEGITIPVEQIGNYSIPQSPYHMGDLEQIHDIQAELDKTRSQQLTHRKRNVAKLMIREDAFDNDAKQAMQSSIVGDIIPIKGELPLTDVVKEVQLAPLASESYAISSQSQQDVYEITGISEYQRGTAPDMTRTATEAQIMQGSSNVKLEAKLNTIEQAVRNVGEYLLAIARDVYPTTDTDEMAMFIGGIDGRAINQLEAGEQAGAALDNNDLLGAQAIAATANLYGEAIVEPTEEVFAGVYEVLVQHSSTDAVNPRAKAQKYSDIIMRVSELVPMLQQMGVNVDMGKLLRLWLEAEGIPGVEGLLAGAPPQPDPTQAQAGDPNAETGATGQPGIGENDIMGLLQAASSGIPESPVGPENSGSLDPNDYPLVGA